MQRVHTSCFYMESYMIWTIMGKLNTWLALFVRKEKAEKWSK